jgi:hypothetical protein
LARKSFFFADFNPAVWHMRVPADLGVDAPGLVRVAQDVVPDVPPPPTVAELAPDGADRTELKTVFLGLAANAHDDFGTFAVRHVRAYAEGTDDNPNPDDIVERSFVQPRDFHLYELQNNPGQVYVTTQEAVVRRIYRRARETHGANGLALNLRNTSLNQSQGEMRR